MSTDEPLLYGLAAVRGALLGRQRDVLAVLLDRSKTDKTARWIEHETERQGVRLERCDRATIDRDTGTEGHGGFAARVGERTTVHPSELVRLSDTPALFMLDGVEDPYNLGFAIRSMWASGIDGLILRRRNWDHVAGIVARSSAGASEMIPLAMVDHPKIAVEIMTSEGVHVTVTSKDRGSIPLFDADFTRPSFILIGGEKRGVSREVMERADTLVNIPYGREFRQSIGTTAAASVISFEILRQRTSAR